MKNSDHSRPTNHDSHARGMKETMPVRRFSDTASAEDTVAMTLPSGFGRYTILEEKGQGAMGAVYLAHDTQLDRDIALKIPKFPKEASHEFVKRFFREARAAATLSHPNICPVHDVGEIDGTYYITMAFIQGRPLSDYLESGKQLVPGIVARIIRKVALAMDEAHAQGVVHRDLKPANIMINQRHEPIVMDFGLARRTDKDVEVRLTQDGRILGSPAYMSPEQLDGQPDQIGPSCDIYSLGVLMYEMLTGQLPFRGAGSVASLIREIFSEEPANPVQLRADLDPHLAEICLKAMAKTKAERYASMNDMASALSRYLSGRKDQPADVSGMSFEALAPATAPIRVLPSVRRTNRIQAWHIWLAATCIAIVCATIVTVVVSLNPLASDDGNGTANPSSAAGGSSAAVPSPPSEPVDQQQPVPPPAVRADPPNGQSIQGRQPHGPVRPRWRNMEEMFQQLDTDRDGRLATDDLPQSERDRLIRADVNRDGYVTFPELRAFEENFRPDGRRSRRPRGPGGGRDGPPPRSGGLP